MFKDLLRNRLFMGGLVFFVLFVSGGLLYLSHVKRTTERDLARSRELLKQWEASQQQQQQTENAQAPVGDTSQGGHWHGDEWHAEPHTTPAVMSVETQTPDVSAARKSETPSRTVSVSSGGTVPLPTDLHAPVAWTAYYQAVEPEFPSDVDDEAGWDAYIHALAPDAKEPADLDDSAAWTAYSAPVRDEQYRINAEQEKLRERLYALPPETFGETDRERALFFIEVYSPYTQARNRLHNEIMRRQNQRSMRMQADTLERMRRQNQ